VVDEVAVQAPWSFGPIPPGAFRSPSYKESIQIAIDWSVDWTLNNSDRPILVGGYSQGAEAASRFRMEFEPGGRLEHLRQNWVCGYVFGNPSRHYETTYFGGPGTPWEGIAVYRLPNIGYDWCELIDPSDLYGTCARGLVGEIERDVYSLCTEMEMHSGWREFAQTFVANLLEVVRNLDGDAYDDLEAGVARYNVDLEGATVAPVEKVKPLSDGLLSIQGIAAAIAAAIDGLIFFCTSPPTASHIEYHIREAWPGMTYVNLGIQHVHDWVRNYSERTNA